MKNQKISLVTTLIACILSYIIGVFSYEMNLSIATDIKQTARDLMLNSRPNYTAKRIEFFSAFPHIADVVMVGDSITELTAWNEIFPEVRIANRGIIGNTTKDIIGRMDSIISLKPKKAFIMAGINDIYYYEVGADEIFSNYQKIISALQKNKITPIIQSTIECSKSVCGERKLIKVRELNKKLYEYAKNNNIEYIDVNSAISSEDDGLLAKYTDDGIHINALGYLQWSKLIEKLMKI